MASRHGLEIRGATAADAPGLADLLSAAGLPTTPRFLAERLDSLRHGPCAVFLATEWGPPSGVIALGWLPTLGPEALVAQITMLLVGPDDRRRGVARLLLKAGAQAARTAGCGVLQIQTPPRQTDLEAFCRATGFTESGVSFGRGLRKRVHTDGV